MKQNGNGNLNGICRVVKLVIWDLDETFWHGILSEGEVVPITANIDVVQELARRGIISSICSRNELSAATAELERLGIWGYFVFPEIHWSPKGASVRRIINSAGLKAENVLFIDDEASNRAEAEHYNPGLMCLNSDFDMELLLQNEFLFGNPDSELVRLSQYKILERKQLDRSSTELSNIDFLRASNIQVRISYQIDEHIPRVIDLVNRANQLNFTKRSLKTNDDLSDFRRVLRSYGFKIGVVFAQDNYGEYGLIGFFMYHVENHELVHFVFSCRVITMGIEQFVYESLGSPKIRVVPPIANEICLFEKVDWISEQYEDRSLSALQESNTLLLGGCEMLQVGTYLSKNCIEYTNRASGAMTIVFDDPYFVLSNPYLVNLTKSRDWLPVWTFDDMQEFDRDVREADCLVLQYYGAMDDMYFTVDQESVVRFHWQTFDAITRSERKLDFARCCLHRAFSVQERLDRAKAAIESILARARYDAQVFLIGQTLLGQTPTQQNKGYGPNEVEKRQRFNSMVSAFSHIDERVNFIDPDIFVRAEWVYDGWHFTREAYLDMATRIGMILHEKKQISG